jgi:hypothetical protein
MRRYNLVSGILLILSIIDFALAVPVSAQEKRQENADVVHMPKDVITVLGKRWEEDLEKLGEEFLKTGGKSVESSSSASSGLGDHGSTNVVQPPAAPNRAPSSPANPDPSVCSASTLSKRGLWAWTSCISRLFYDPDNIWKYEGADGDVDEDFNWSYWLNAKDPPPGPAKAAPPRPASSKEFGGAYWRNVDPANPPSASGYGPGPLPTKPGEDEAVTPPPPDLEPQKEPEREVVPGPPPSPDNRPVDLQAAILAAKGKAKIPGTTRDHVGNAAQGVAAS